MYEYEGQNLLLSRIYMPTAVNKRKFQLLKNAFLIFVLVPIVFATADTVVLKFV